MIGADDQPTAISCTRMVKVHKIHELFATAHIRDGWMEPAQPRLGDAGKAGYL